MSKEPQIQENEVKTKVERVPPEIGGLHFQTQP